MPDSDLLGYVKATARTLDLPLDETRAQAVALHLQRTAGLAQLLDAVPLPVHDEPAEIYCPAPFPPAGSAP